MKLSSLTPQDKNKLAAELDGWKVEQQDDGLFALINIEKQFNSYGWESEEGAWGIMYYQYGGSKYYTSYDEIIPLIQKLDKTTSGLYEIFAHHLITIGAMRFDVTPSQLLDALLVATGKAEL